MNPNNCETCDYKHHPDGGWCYMFRHEPETICMQHTKRNELFIALFEEEEFDRQLGKD